MFLLEYNKGKSDSMIKVENVTKKFEDFSFSLTDINFEIPKGYICGLIGENGAGKSTLISMILGLYRPNKGEIYVNGSNIVLEEAKVKEQIGYVLAEELFDSNQTLMGNANTYGKYYSKYDPKLFIEYCERFELDYKCKLKRLSKGQKLKFQFAFALSHKPMLLVLDEPTANFDPKFRKEFFDILVDFISDGEHSVILATHLTSDLEVIGDYITFLHKGRLVFSDDREKLLSSYRLLQGPAYKGNLLNKDRVIRIEKKDNMMTALVKYSKFEEYDKELMVSIPTIEEIMYHYVKEDK